MSMLRCEDCGGQIDTDKDVECEVYVGNYRRLHATEIVCAPCRDKRIDRQDAEDAAADRCETEAERSHA